jgi:hypothetical protein
MKPTTKARHIHRALTDIAADYGYRAPTLKGHMVVWEEGPFDWAPSAIGGESIFCGELGRYDLLPEPKLRRVLGSNPELTIECENSFTLGVYA